MKGFYRSEYQLPSGLKKYAAVTQFEAIDARRALPCWDEPARKATFDVRIVAEADKTVLSNMVRGDNKIPLVHKKKSIILSRWLILKQ
jgi:aminopeptidase N